jgi:hypothetical protein
VGAQRHTSQRGQRAPAGGGYWHTGTSMGWGWALVLGMNRSVAGVLLAVAAASCVVLSAFAAAFMRSEQVSCSSSVHDSSRASGCGCSPQLHVLLWLCASHTFAFVAA